MKNLIYLALLISSLNAFAELDVASMSPAQIGALTEGQIKDVTPAQIAALSDEQVEGITIQQVLRLSEEQAKAFSPRQKKLLSLGFIMQRGFKPLSRSDAGTIIGFKNPEGKEGKFLISKNLFQNHQAAADFCRSQPGYALTTEQLPVVLYFFGAPFAELEGRFFLKVPEMEMIDSGNEKHVTTQDFGALFWYQVKVPIATPEEEAKLSGDDKLALDAVRSNDYVAFDRFMGSELIGGAFSTKLLNEQRKAKGLGDIALPAICQDADMQDAIEPAR